MNKYFLGFLFLGIASVASAEQPVIVICRTPKCKPADMPMTREYLKDKLASILESNLNQNVSFCEADPTTRTCRSGSLDFALQAGVTGSIARIPFAKLIDVKNSGAHLDFILEYHVSAGNTTYPECQASSGKLFVPAEDEVVLSNSSFGCRFTSEGVASINPSYQIDYVDLDHGVLGASYTISVGKDSYGGNRGYVLMRFDEFLKKNAEKKPGCGCGCNKQTAPSCPCNKKASEQEKVATIQEENTVIQKESVTVQPQNVVVQTQNPAIPENVIVEEKVITEYETAPVEVIVKTKTPLNSRQQIKVNGVTVSEEPVVIDNFEVRTLTQ